MKRSIADAGWRFDNSYARLPEALFARTLPSVVRAPAIVLVNTSLASELGLDATILAEAGTAIFAGNELPPGADPIAQAYAGHQFGHFTNLGDGRAILLGEQITPDNLRFDIQLKGSGRTRYSRGGDGRAALGPMLREYCISEAMHALGIPTTRSLAVARSGEVVMRATPLPGAVLTRVAASHIRVGTFQYTAALGDPKVLAALLDHAIARHASELTRLPPDERAVAFFEAVVERQASLIAQWLHIGFVHGVMNTDNMAVSGETIDYGPCAFLDAYDPATVFSSIDQQGRYAFGNQPGIAHWNLARFAETLLPLVPGEGDAVIETMRDLLDTFPDRFAEHHLAGARAKLGLTTVEDGDRNLFADLLDRLQKAGSDFTATFARLADQVESASQPTPCPSDEIPTLSDWLAAWRSRLSREPGSPADAAARLRRANPIVIPRNHKVEEALTAAEGGDLGPFERLMEAVRSPFARTPENEPYRGRPPAGCGPYRTFCGT